MSAPAASSSASSAPTSVAASSSQLDVTPSACSLLGLINDTVSAESTDYTQTKQQFQLHTLLTEQRHAKTRNMSQTIQSDCEEGLKQLLSVDEDITVKINELLADATSLATLHQLTTSISTAILQHRKIYIYGCGATGRLAKLMESTFWRPFWSRVKTTYPAIWQRILPHIHAHIESTLIGEMTGADRALISSLEGFEDLQVIGEIQMQEHHISKGDVVIAVTEGGETSSVIGTILAAERMWHVQEKVKEHKEHAATTASDASTAATAPTPATSFTAATASTPSSHLFFLYNNPDSLLLPFTRSSSVLLNNNITKLNLSTGPQSITGSTRMQATTIETYVLACALHVAVEKVLRETVKLTEEEMKQVGFTSTPSTIESKLLEFSSILNAIKSASASLAVATEWESATYAKNQFSTYFANSGLMTVFIDSTERSPTFRLYPLDTIPTPYEMEIGTKRKCWITIWSSAMTQHDAWHSFLGREFKGMTRHLYGDRFHEEIQDPYLKSTALRSLPNSGSEQAELYDFSMSDENVQRRGGISEGGDFAMLVIMQDELTTLSDPQSKQVKFIQIVQQVKDARVVVMVVAAGSEELTEEKLLSQLKGKAGLNDLDSSRIKFVIIALPSSSSSSTTSSDPFSIHSQLSLKIALNAHSTGVMSRLGKVHGNCMVNVNPGNLKLIGRATYLIQVHVNEALTKAGEEFKAKCISYGLANALLYDTMSALRAAGTTGTTAGQQQSAEVSVSIVRALESITKGQPCKTEEAMQVVQEKGLTGYLKEFEARWTK